MMFTMSNSVHYLYHKNDLLDLSLLLCLCHTRCTINPMCVHKIYGFGHEQCRREETGNSKKINK